MKKRFALVFLFLTVGVGLFQAYLFIHKAPSSEAIYKIIEIEPGSTFLEVTDLLKQEALLASPVSFRLLGKITRNESKIKPGEYRLHSAMPPMELLDTLVRGDIVTYRIVIPEGTSSKEIGKILEKSDILDAEVFYRAAQDKAIIRKLGFDVESLEGYLFPDTYYFSKRIAPEKILRQMTRQFRAVYDDEFAKKAEELGMTQQEVLTLASII